MQLRDEPGDDVLLDRELRHEDRVDDVERAHVELDGTALRQHEHRAGDVPSVGVAEGELELLRGDVDAQRVLRLCVVAGEDDRADDRDRGDEDERDDRPRDLEARVSVDGRSVLEVVLLHPELDDRVDHHRGDDREDEDADRDHEPEGEGDPARLL